MTAQYLKKGGIAAMILAAIALVAAIFWGNDNATARALNHHGAVAMAYAVQKQPAPAGDEDARPEITYAYQSLAADGTRQTHRIAHEVPASVFARTVVGQQVQVRYLPEDPVRAEVYAGEHADGGTFLDYLALVAAVAAALATLAGLQLSRRPSKPMAQPA